jgi:ADP-ribose pyrophosphatase YjhB (NUDIX family)
LQRQSKHNNQKWGLPGGNVEADDSSLLTTATREANEEMSSLPPFEVLGQIQTLRGKHDQKHFTVFVAAVSGRVRQEFTPVLADGEHRWVVGACTATAARLPA